MTDLGQDSQFQDWDFAYVVLEGASLCIFVSADKYCILCLI